MRAPRMSLLLVLVAAGCTPERSRSAMPSGEEDAGGTGDVRADGAEVEADAAADVPRADAGHVGCPRWRYSDHNGCYRLRTRPVDGECDPDLRSVLSGGLHIEDLDELAPLRGVPGRRAASQRTLLVQGTAEVIAPGRLEVLEAGEDGRRLVLDPGLPEGEVLLVMNGAEVEVEVLEYVNRVTDPRTEEVLREDRSSLLRISEAGGALVYALGDPFVQVRAVDETLERLGLRIEVADEPQCGYREYEGMMTPVGWCLIYRRNAAWDVFTAGGDSVGVTTGEVETLQVEGRAYRIESGDTYLIDDSHDDCNVPPRTELRITRTG